MTNQDSTSGWFAGPKAENGEWFGESIRQILQDYYYWRRNYFPEDSAVLDSQKRRGQDSFRDAMDDKLMELLARLKGDFPFHSPRYVGHMVAEQTLPSIAGYFAAMLYNPNNVASDVAPITVQLELEASQMIAKMLGYRENSWAHLTSGGTIANFEALWIARTVATLPLVIRDMQASLGQAPNAPNLGASPMSSLEQFAQVFRAVGDDAGPAIRAYLQSPYNVAEQGLAQLSLRLGSSPVVILPETHHYCFQKAMDLLGMGRRSLETVKVDRDFRMRTDVLESKIEEVEARGQYVLAVVAVVGTTEEGAVDPINEILDLRASRERAGKNSFWLHADAAYGGYLKTLTLPGRIGLGEPTARVQIAGTVREIELHLPAHSACDALERLGECDSITIDPHKLGYVPYPAGAICFRSDIVKPLARQNAPYLEDSAGGIDVERESKSIGVYILEGSKPGAAAASVWLSHNLIPLDSQGHGQLIQQTVRNASELYELLEGYPQMAGAQSVQCVCLCRPGSNIVCYAFKANGRQALEEINSLNRELYARFSLPEGSGKRVYDQRFFVSRTALLANQYDPDTVSHFLQQLGVGEEEYRRSGVFLLRSVLMNPWLGLAKESGRYYLSEFVEDLYRQAAEISRCPEARSAS